MRGGQLRKRINIERYNQTRDAHGAVVRNWATIGCVWGKIENMGGSDIADGAQLNSKANVRITIRYNNFRIDTSMRLSYLPPGSVSLPRYFHIANVSNIEERNRTIELQCIEGKPNT